MKRIFTQILALLIGVSTQINAQTIRRVNNTPGLNDPNVYATLQAAHDAATNGDIISIEPSNNASYGNVTITKIVSIVGPGYLLDKNPNTFFDKRRIDLGNISFEGGSQGSSIQGIVCYGMGIFVPNVTVERCVITANGLSISRSPYLYLGAYPQADNATIKNNIITYISGSGESGINGIISAYCTNTIITNNIILTNISIVGGGVISNNTIGGRMVNIVNCSVTNNIFDLRTSAEGVEAITSSGSSISNNVCTSINALPAGNGNVNAVNPNVMFVNGGNPFITFYSHSQGMLDSDSIFQLTTGSPAKTAAVGGGEAGAFGNGANAYKLSGLPKAPIITSFTNSGSGSNTTPLSISISVRSNN